MTDNEKAATFIGFVPFAQGDAGAWYDEHANPAPDMDRPENYMRAMEAISTKGYNIVLEDRWQLTIDRDNDSGGEDTIIYRVKESLGELMTTSLAALYDAEHRTDATARV